jgi:hypothetical protein
MWRAHPVGSDRELAERWRKVHALMLAHPVIEAG